MKPVTSIFYSHYNNLMEISDPSILTEKIKNITKNSKIKDMDKRRILFQVEPIRDNLSKLQKYLTNSMLQYQNLKVIR